MRATFSAQLILLRLDHPNNIWRTILALFSDNLQSTPTEGFAILSPSLDNVGNEHRPHRYR